MELRGESQERRHKRLRGAKQAPRCRDLGGLAAASLGKEWSESQIVCEAPATAGHGIFMTLIATWACSCRALVACVVVGVLRPSFQVTSGHSEDQHPWHSETWWIVDRMACIWSAGDALKAGRPFQKGHIVDRDSGPQSRGRGAWDRFQQTGLSHSSVESQH